MIKLQGPCWQNHCICYADIYGIQGYLDDKGSTFKCKINLGITNYYRESITAELFYVLIYLHFHLQIWSHVPVKTSGGPLSAAAIL
jgi:hypothetical protein